MNLSVFSHWHSKTKHTFYPYGSGACYPRPYCLFKQQSEYQVKIQWYKLYDPKHMLAFTVQKCYWLGICLQKFIYSQAVSVLSHT